MVRPERESNLAPTEGLTMKPNQDRSFYKKLSDRISGIPVNGVA